MRIASIGPRARRRAAWAGVLALVVIASSTYYLTTAKGGASRSGTTLPNMDLGISYGYTPAQVQRRIGPPTLKHGPCWIYVTKDRKVRGIWAGPYTDRVRFCFSSGVVSDVHDHQVAYIWKHQYVRAQWILPLVFSPPWEHPVQPG